MPEPDSYQRHDPEESADVRLRKKMAMAALRAMDRNVVDGAIATLAQIIAGKDPSGKPVATAMRDRAMAAKALLSFFGNVTPRAPSVTLVDARSQNVHIHPAEEMARRIMSNDDALQDAGETLGRVAIEAGRTGLVPLPWDVVSREAPEGNLDRPRQGGNGSTGLPSDHPHDPPAPREE